MTDLRGSSINGDDVFGHWAATDDSGAVFAYESNFASIELPAADFDA